MGRKRCTRNRADRKLQNLRASKPIQTLGRASQAVNCSWSQCIKSHHAQTSSGKGLPSHFWNRNIVRSILPALRRKRTGLLLSGPKSSFQMKINITFSLEIKVWRKSGEAQTPSCLKSSVKFPKSEMIWGAVTSAVVGPLCFIKCKVNAAVYQEILEIFKYFEILEFFTFRSCKL